MMVLLFVFFNKKHHLFYSHYHELYPLFNTQSSHSMKEKLYLLFLPVNEKRQKREGIKRKEKDLYHLSACTRAASKRDSRGDKGEPSG